MTKPELQRRLSFAKQNLRAVRESLAVLKARQAAHGGLESSVDLFAEFESDALCAVTMLEDQLNQKG